MCMSDDVGEGREHSLKDKIRKINGKNNHSHSLSLSPELKHIALSLSLTSWSRQVLLPHFTGEETEVQQMKSLPLFPWIHSKGVLLPHHLVTFNCEVLVFLEFC